MVFFNSRNGNGQSTYSISNSKMKKKPREKKPKWRVPYLKKEKEKKIGYK